MSMRTIVVLGGLAALMMFSLFIPHRAYGRTLWDAAVDPVPGQSVTVSVRVIGPTQDELLAATNAANQTKSAGFNVVTHPNDELAAMILLESALIAGFFYTVRHGVRVGGRRQTKAVA